MKGTHMFKQLLAMALGAAVIFSTGCAAAGSSSGSAKKKDLVIGLEADAATMIANTAADAATDTQIRNIYDPLITRDAKTGELKPCLATAWKSLDENTWDFTLRQGVKFQNGDPFNAQAVKFSIEYILNKANQSYYLSRWTMVKEVNIISDYEVQVVTSTPAATFPRRVAEDLLILDPTYVNKVGVAEAAKTPVGTGAYKFSEWKRGQYLKLTANENYWGGKPSIQNVEFRYIPEFSSRLASFLNGEIDLFNNVPVDSINQIKNSSNAKIAEVGSARVDYLALNTFSKGPMQNEQVRQAMNYAIDVDGLLKNVLNGYGNRITGPLAKNNTEYASTPAYPYDPDKAVSLLKQAGYDPAKMTLTLDSPNGRYPMDKQVAQAVAAQLQKIGIHVDVHVNEWATQLSKIRQRQAGDIFLLGWGPAFDAQTTIQNLFTKDAPYSSFYDPEVESAITTADQTFNGTQRKADFAQIQQTLVQKAAWVPLWQQQNVYAVNKNLKFTPRADETMPVFDMSWSK